MKLEELRLAKSGLTDNIYVGFIDGDKWRAKTDITGDFLKAVIDRFAGYKETISDSEGNKYQIIVKKLLK